MAAQQKIVLSASRDIPFNKLVLSQANVRRVKAGLSIEQLAESIAQRTLLQSLSVRPVRDAEGNETGMFEVPAGGRRYRALELLVKQKRMVRTQPVPCVVRLEGVAEDDSFAENDHREDLHPLDQFRSFQSLIEKGFGEEEIAARHFVSVAIVRQRLKLAAVSPKLLELYESDEITLEQLMAFTVTADQARQEQVWESLEKSYNKEAYYIRRLLTETAVRASDRRAQFIGIDAYEAAGGVVMRDLFEEDGGGWLQDPGLLDRLVAEKLKQEAQTIAAEGWKWVEAALNFPYGHTNGLRRLAGEAVEMTDEERANYEALQAEFQQLEQEYAEADELPDEADARIGEVESLMASFERRPMRFAPEDITKAGVFISLDADGELEIDRGFVRPEDEASDGAADGDAESFGDHVSDADGDHPTSTGRAVEIRVAGDAASPPIESAADDDAVKPLSDRLVMELTAHRTLALRDSLAGDFDTAFLSVLHALCLSVFYRYSSVTCLEILAKSSGFSAQAPGLKDTASAKAIAARHEQWERQLPEDDTELWGALQGFDPDSRSDLFAHCASLSVNAVREPWNRDDARLRHADQLAQAVELDMAAAGWSATTENYLGRVSKARILEAVREVKGGASAELIDHLKKADMAREAERLLEGTGWLPEPLRLGAADEAEVSDQAVESAPAELPAFLADDGHGDNHGGDEPSSLIAAE